MSLPVRTPRGKRQQQLRQQRSGLLPTANGGSSAGLFGTIRSVVTAPLNWFGGSSEPDATKPGDDDEVMAEAGDKRRHHSPGNEPAAKRLRRGSPTRDDEEHIPRPRPPTTLPPPPPVARKLLAIDLPEPALPALPAQVARVSQANKRGVVRSQSLALTTSSFGRAPAPSSNLRNSVDRHMSVDPPNAPGFGSRDSVLARSSMFMARGQSLTRADSLGPHRSPTHARLTPMSSGASFGPLPPRKSRDPSAPPLLAGTVDSRRSPFKTSLQRTTSATHVPSSLSTSSTFGPLSSANSDLSRLAWNAPLTSATSSESSKPTAALQNAADIVFQKAEANRTPLLPSIPNVSAQALTNLRRPRVKVPIPVPDAEIGHFKKSTREPPTSPAPYNAGSSGLKRLLARRREEELRESTGHKDVSIGTDPEPEPAPAFKAHTVNRQASIMEVDDVDQPLPKKSAPTAGPSRVISAPPSPAAPRNANAGAAARGPSLRAPKSNEFSKRTHQRSANKFSAIMEDDEDENADLPTEEELMKLASAAPIEFKLPMNFSLPKTTVTNPASTAPATSSSAFSFPPAKPAELAVAPTSLGSAFSFATKPAATNSIEPAAAPKPVNIFASPPARPSTSSTPFSFAPSPGKSTQISTSIFSSNFSSSHPTTDVDNPMDDSEPEPAPAPAPKPAMPSFFPSVASPAATKPTASEPPKSFSFGPAPPLFGAAPSDKKDAGMPPIVAAPALSFGASASAPADKPPAFGGFGASPASTAPPSFGGFGKPASDIAKPVDAQKPFSFAPTAAIAPAAPAQPLGAPKPFSFGPPAAITPTTPAQSVETPKPFSFGPSTTAAAPAKPLEAPKPFSFGPTTTAPAVERPSLPSLSFSFGGTTSTEPKPATSTGLTTPPPTDENRMQESPERPTPVPAPAPAFGSTATATSSSGLFSFGGAPKPPAINTSSTGGMFSFGGAAGAAPAAAPAASPFSATPAASSSAPFSFGQSSMTTTPAAEPPKPAGSLFSFGAAAPAAEVPKPAATNSPFSFGAAPATGSSTAPFSFGGPSGPAAVEAPKPASSPFSFGAAAAAPAEPKPASPFSFGNGEAAKPATPFGFGSQNGAPAQPSGSTFSFGQPAEISRPASSASTPFAFGAQNPATAPSFGGTAPASPAFGFGHPPLPDVARAASPFATPQPPSQPQSPFNAPQTFGAAPPAPAAAPGFSFNTNPGAAGINNPFSQPSSPINGPGFTLGAPDARQTKPMPRRRTQQRR